MIIVKPLHILGLCALLLAPAACVEGGGGQIGLSASGTGSGAGFRARYMTARMALEGGEYDKAARAYKALVARSGPFAPRIRLEYAHSLLRAGKFTLAAKEARDLATSQNGKLRSAALLVEGTAQHEVALAAMAKGHVDKRVIVPLRLAKLALDEALDAHSDLDPLGAMADRRKTITAQLAAF